MASQLISDSFANDQALGLTQIMITMQSLVSNLIDIKQLSTMAVTNFSSWPPLVQTHSFIDSKSNDAFDY